MAGALPAELCVDIGAICRNYLMLRAIAAGSACGAVLKADAYGLGAFEISRALFLSGCRRFFVTDIDEALALAPGVLGTADVFTLNGLVAARAHEYRAAGVVPVLNSLGEIRVWTGLARYLSCRLPAAIQIDTGMSRLGLSATDVASLKDDRGLLDGLELRLVLSHLAQADDPADPMNDWQRRRFEELRRQLPPAPASLANSAGLLLGSRFHFDLVRPGIALYGLQPSRRETVQMEPVVRLSATVCQIRNVADGTPVGYGASFRTRRASRLAVVGIGYADGIPRCLGNRGAVWFGDVRLPMVGRVSMDCIIVDASDLPENKISPGSCVEVIGPHQSVESLADAADTIGYEILTGIGRRRCRSQVSYIGFGTELPRHDTQDF